MIGIALAFAWGVIACKLADKYSIRPWSLGTTRQAAEDSTSDQQVDTEPFRLFSIDGGKQAGFNVNSHIPQNSTPERSEEGE